MNQPVSENQALRYRRLAFYAEDVERLNEALLAFVKKSNARSVLLIDKDGHLVSRQGLFEKADSSALAALVAGSFASTREVAKQLGEAEFKVLFHQGRTTSIHITLVGERTLQVAVFDVQVKAGIIQVLARDLAQRLDVILAEIAARPPKAADDPAASLDQNFTEAAKKNLDDLFGGL